MSSKKEQRTTSNQTQTVAPPTWTAPGLAEISGRVMDASRKLPAPYTGDFYAQLDPAMQTGVVDAYGRAANKAAEVGNMTQQVYKALTDMNFGAARTPVSFEYGGPVSATPTAFQSRDGTAELQAAMGAAINPVMKQLTEQVLPGIKSSALDAGAYGNSRAMSVLPTVAIDNATESANRITQGLAFENFQQAENRRLAAHDSYTQALQSAFNLATQRTQGQAGIEGQLFAGDADREMAAQRMVLERASLAPQVADTVMRMFASNGDLLERAMSQDAYGRQLGIDNAIARDNYDATVPFRGLDIAAQLLAQLSGNYGTTTAKGDSTTVEKTGGLGNLLQGAMGLAGMAFGLPGMGSAAKALKPAAPAAAAFTAGDPAWLKAVRAGG